VSYLSASEVLEVFHQHVFEYVAVRNRDNGCPSFEVSVIQNKKYITCTLKCYSLFVYALYIEISILLFSLDINVHDGANIIVKICQLYKTIFRHRQTYMQENIC